MKIGINNITINYTQYGTGKDIVLLHGWGQNIEMMAPLGNLFSDKYRITILDLPGFGESMEPDRDYTIYDYATIVEEIFNKLHINNPIIMGHSFGGRIAIVLASRNRIDKLVLFGSPCIRREEKLSFKVKVLKLLKKIPGINKLEGYAKTKMGSRDYRSASKRMREVLVNVINEDLSPCALKIKCPTLLIWGDKDTEAPLEDAKELEKMLKDGGLIVLPNSTHYAYLENLRQVGNILEEFFKE